MSGSVFVYKNDAMIRVPKEQVQFTIDKENITAKDLPCICSVGNNQHSLICVAMEYFEDEEEYLVDFSPNKIFSTTLFIEEHLPSEIGAPVALTAKGEVVKAGAGAGITFGFYLGKKGNAVLFRLLGLPPIK